VAQKKFYVHTAFQKLEGTLLESISCNSRYTRSEFSDQFPMFRLHSECVMVLISNCSAERSFSKYETDKEQTSHIDVQWPIVSRGSDEHRSGHSSSDQLRGPGNRTLKEESMNSFTTLKCLHVQCGLSTLRLLVI